MIGIHNIQNALAAISLGLELNIAHRIILDMLIKNI